MATVWITYAWADNKNQDVDFIAQELRSAGLDVKLDRWNIQAGKRLWEQIQKFISDPEESDAWLMVATENSLKSQPCKEEFAYALDRALNTRGGDFPVIALFMSSVDSHLIPPAIKVRLFLNISDSDWKERVVAAVEGRSLGIPTASIDPFLVQVHQLSDREKYKFAIEIRPRAGVWNPFLVAYPISEKDKVEGWILHGVSGTVPKPSIMRLLGHFLGQESKCGTLWSFGGLEDATPTKSYYILCKALPSEIRFGSQDGQKYRTTFRQP